MKNIFITIILHFIWFYHITIVYGFFIQQQQYHPSNNVIIITSSRRLLLSLSSSLSPRRGKRGNEFYQNIISNTSSSVDYDDNQLYVQQEEILPFENDNTMTMNHKSSSSILLSSWIRYRARISYDGTNFCGFQLQNIRNNNIFKEDKNNMSNSKKKKKNKGIAITKRTVQGMLEDILTQRFGGYSSSSIKKSQIKHNTKILPIRVTAAGRTDSGVHAKGQAIHFDIITIKTKEQQDQQDNQQQQQDTQQYNDNNNDYYYNNHTLKLIEQSINRMLPCDVILWNLQIAPKWVTKPIAAVSHSNINSSSTTIMMPTKRNSSNNNTVIQSSSQQDNNTDNRLLEPDDYNNQQDQQQQTEFVNYKWNAMYDTTKKLYSYRLSFGTAMEPLHRYNRWHPDLYLKQNNENNQFDPIRFQSLLDYYVGTHDFRAFAGSIERLEKLKLLSLALPSSSDDQYNVQNTDEDDDNVQQQRLSEDHEDDLSTTSSTVNTKRTVYTVQLIKENNNGHYRIDFIIKGALYKQVRNMVGTVLDVYRNKITKQRFYELLNQCQIVSDDKNIDNFDNDDVHDDDNNDDNNINGNNRMSEKPILSFLTASQNKQKIIIKPKLWTRKDNKSKPAPPEGLTLEYVYYDNDDDQSF